MHGSTSTISEILSGYGKHFIIPVYQRRYSWKKENCAQLFDDLVRMQKNGYSKHFFGSIVAVQDPNGGMHDYLIIDGQQRLTTVSLMLLAMRNLLKEGRVTAQDPNLAEAIYSDFLINKSASDDRQFRILHSEDDKAAYQALFDPAAKRDEISAITFNYDYFFNRIQQHEITIDQLFEAIRNLQIISITLHNGDNPQRIFESLNSTGLPLKEGDKVRNYILMGSTDAEEQKQYYKSYWKRIEDYAGDDSTPKDVSAFIRDYLSVKQLETPNIQAVYTAFKDYHQRKASDLTTEALLQDMLEYAKLYDRLLHPNTGAGATELDRCIYRLNRLKTTVSRPFFMEVLRIHKEGKLKDGDLLQIFRLTETFLFRRTICDLPTSSLNKIFLFLHRDVLRLDGTEENYLSKLVYVLRSKKDNARFPTDGEFTTALSAKNVYGMRGESKHYLFERLENGGLKGGGLDVWHRLTDHTLTIEHIMPQTLTRSWIDDLGGEETALRLHNDWLHRLANLTLTAYNSEYKNHRFQDKKTMEGGFEEGGLHINAWIKNQTQWTETELKQRDEKLKGQALILWPMPTSEYQPPVKQLDRYALDDEESMTGKIIAKYAFRGVEQSVVSWADMYHQVLMQLHAEDKSVLTNLAHCDDPNVDMAVHFSTDPDAYHSSRQIDERLFVWTGTNTQSKINLLKKIFALFSVPEDQLIFYMENTEDPGSDTAGYNDMRRQYWRFAIDGIRQATGSFGNSGESSSNTIMGSTGKGYALALCVANYESVRTEIYLQHKEKAFTKETFDRLYTHKDEIEATFGGPLHWYRNDDGLASKVYAALDGIGIYAESNWPTAAQFHADKMAALMKAVAPWL